MATETYTAPVKTTPMNVHTFNAEIGYTLRPLDGTQPPMDDLANENPLYREVRRAKISNVRGTEHNFTLEENGFQYFKLPSIPGDGLVDFENEGDPKILELYYKGISEWFAGVSEHTIA